MEVRMATVADMASHIAKVCRLEDIEVASHSSGGRAYRRSRRIKIRPVKSAITYAIALHEIGHILGPRQSGVRLDKEVGAWEWAKANAIVWNAEMAAKVSRCLQSYLSHAMTSKHWRKPGPDHPIHAMIA